MLKTSRRKRGAARFVHARRACAAAAASPSDINRLPRPEERNSVDRTRIRTRIRFVCDETERGSNDPVTYEGNPRRRPAGRSAGHDIVSDIYVSESRTTACSSRVPGDETRLRVTLEMRNIVVDVVTLRSEIHGAFNPSCQLSADSLAQFSTCLINTT